MDKLFLIDGHALVFKMYYAFLRRPMINSKGVDTSILFGFTKYLLELIDKEKPSHIAVAFDPPGGTFRNQLYPAYKGTRPPTPQLVIDALEPLSEIVRSMNIPVLMLPGFEADDVIGSMAIREASPTLDVYMVTPDKDYGQLISDHIFQFKPGKGGGESELVDKAALCEKWGIGEPSQMIDMLALCGDSADNVPGVKGIGEVGAGKLISRYGSMENIYAHLDELSERQKAQFSEAQEYIGLSKTLVTIKTDIPLETTLEDMRFDGDFTPEIVGLFDKYEFNSLRRYISHVKAETPAEEKPKEFEVRAVAVDEICSLARRSRAVGIKAEASGEGLRARISKLSLGVEGAVCQISGNQLDSVRALLEDDSVEKYGYDLKNISKLLSFAGIKLQGFWADIALMHYLINPERSHDIALLSKSFLGISLESGREIATSLFDEPQDDEDTVDKEAAVLVELGKAVRKELGERERLYLEMEEPLAKVLAKMELAGVKVDMAQISSFADGLRQELTELERNIRTEANAPELNISSPKQVGELLFDRLKLDPKAKKSGAKGQYPTDEATLQELNNPIADKILEFRAVKKLLSTYIEPFPSFVSPVDGRVHTTFNQALTATGRLSSSNPNLQNIPIRTERGKEIRKAFVPGTPEGVIVSADYSQIELRIMAHLSCDEHLVNAFRSGMDVHKATAAKIFKVPEDEVTREMRSMAKTANFGIMYGISSFGLAQRLQLGRKEAKKLIDDYFESFPAIRGFIDDSIAFARENGYVETLFGRRRYLPDINSKNATVRSLAERNAVNAPIQGTAADIIKLAMIRLDKRLSEEGLKSRMVLQIHDELLFDALPEEVGALEKIVVEEMENVLKLSVPLTVECSAGKNWLEAH